MEGSLHGKTAVRPVFLRVLYYLFVVYFTALPVRLDVRSSGMLHSLD